jgi:hypothetical protein
MVTHGRGSEGKTFSTLHTTSEHGVSSITTADAHTSAALAPYRFKWTRPFRRKTKSGFCVCAITFQTQSTTSFVQNVAIFFRRDVCNRSSLFLDVIYHRFLVSLRRSGTTHRYQFQGCRLQWSNRLIDPCRCPQTAATNYQSRLRNISGQQRTYFHRGESLKSRTTFPGCSIRF